MSTRKRRIAVFHNLPSGGGLRMLDHIIKRYKSTHDIDLYTIGDLKQNAAPGIKTVNTFVSPWGGFVFRNLWIIFVLPFFHKKLADIINNNYDLAFVTHDYFTKSPYLLRFLKIHNIYLCQEPQREFYEPSSVHSPGVKEKVATILRIPIMLIDKTNVKSAEKIISNSKYSQEVIKNVYGRTSSVIYPGVDEAYFSPIRAQRKRIILCVGGINPVKNQLFLVRSLKSLLGLYKLILVGSGKKEYVNKIIKECGKSESVEIIKNISDDELRSLYRSAMVTCISAYREPFGLSSIESQACGTPVVSVNEGGPMETIIDGKTGYLVNKNREEEYLQKVMLAIKNSSKLGEKSRENIINRWTWDKTLRELDRLIQ